MNMTETLLNISRDLGDVKAGMASLHEKIDHQPDMIRLAIKEHEDNCRSSKQFITNDELSNKIEESSNVKLTKVKAVLLSLKEVAVILIAVITGKMI